MVFVNQFFFLVIKMKKNKPSKTASVEKIKSLYWLWFVIIGILLILIVVLFLFCFYSKQKCDDTKKSCGDEFNISNDLSFGSYNETDNNFCLKAIQYQNQTICFQIDKDDQVTIQFGTLKTQNFGPFDSLPDNENADSNCSIAGQQLLIFKYPFADNTICIRNLTQESLPGRLCYNFDKKIAFISAPTDSYIVPT